MTCEIPTPITDSPIVSDTPYSGVKPSFSAHTKTSLASLTTFHVGGQISDYVEVKTEKDFIEAIRDADENKTPILVIGAGSNILANDEPFAGRVIRDLREGITGGFEGSCAGVNVTVPAGQSMDQLVATATEQDWCGIEALSGIPGTVGAACVQNIGAYGAELSGVFARIRTWDRKNETVKTITISDMNFGYRTSLLKQTMIREEQSEDTRSRWGLSPRYVVIDVTLQMSDASLSIPVRYKQLADHLGVELASRVPLTKIREAVLDLRRSKGMLLDEDDRDTWSAGSFFINPVISDSLAKDIPEQAPKMPVYDNSKRTYITEEPLTVPGLVKISAAWLIENAGFSKGYLGTDGLAGLSTKHVLALTNRGNAKANSIVSLARIVQQRVQEKFGIKLVPEPVLIGFSL